MIYDSLFLLFTTVFCLSVYCCLFVSRGGILDSAVCLNAGGRYFMDVVFNKQPGSDGSYILIDSVRKSSYALIKLILMVVH